MQAKSIILFVSIIKLTAVHLQSVFLRSEDWTVIKRIAAASHVFCFFKPLHCFITCGQYCCFCLTMPCCAFSPFVTSTSFAALAFFTRDPVDLDLYRTTGRRLRSPPPRHQSAHNKLVIFHRVARTPSDQVVTAQSVRLTGCEMWRAILCAAAGRSFSHGEAARRERMTRARVCT